MKASRRDYRYLAEALNRSARAAVQLQPPMRIVDALVVELCDILAKDNASFDPVRFTAEVYKGVQK